MRNTSTKEERDRLDARVLEILAEARAENPGDPYWRPTWGRHSGKVYVGTAEEPWRLTTEERERDSVGNGQLRGSLDRLVRTGKARTRSYVSSRRRTGWRLWTAEDQGREDEAREIRLQGVRDAAEAVEILRDLQIQASYSRYDGACTIRGSDLLRLVRLARRVP